MAKARIQGRVDMDASSVGTALGKASSQASAFAAKMKGIGKGLAGAFTAGAVIGLGKTIMSDADRIADLAANTRLTTDELQAFEAVARTSGASAEKLGSSIEKLSMVQGNMASGDADKAIQALESLGLSAADATLPVGELFQRIANGFAATGDVGALDELFGRGSVQLAGTLREIGKAGSLEELIQRQKEAGQVLSAGELSNLATANDRIAALARRGMVAAASFGTPGADDQGAIAEQRAAIEASSRDAQRIAQETRAKAEQDRRAELEKIISGATAPQGLGSELVRIGARGGIAGVEDKAVKLAREQLAALKQVVNNTAPIEDLAPGGTFTP